MSAPAAVHGRGLISGWRREDKSTRRGRDAEAHDAATRLIGARNQLLKGGFKAAITQDILRELQARVPAALDTTRQELPAGFPDAVVNSIYNGMLNRLRRIEEIKNPEAVARAEEARPKS